MNIKSLIGKWIRDEQDNYPELRDKFEKYLDNKEKDNILIILRKI